MEQQEQKFAELIMDVVKKMMPVVDPNTEIPVKGVVGDPQGKTMVYAGKTYVYIADDKLKLKAGDNAIFVPLGNALFFAVGKV